ncbi:hypothetical protein [Prescottella equi]|uniref:hypothetical protein n=1 Tax=Rhodococcus hoagii TaxID=43767 RepID=UPI00111BE57B|nr:hypothetical protein [Prescottella equi]
MNAQVEPKEPIANAYRWTIAIAVVVVVAVAFGVTYHYRVVWFPGYTPDQWAAAGGWVGGLGAFAAVATALWQSSRARHDARALLEHELGAQRRSEQLRSLDGIWAAVDAIRRPYDEFWSALVKAEEDSGYQEGPLEEYTQIANTIGVDLKGALVQANLAFEPSLLQVVEPHTQRMITAFYQDFLDVMESMMKMIAEARKGQDPQYNKLQTLSVQLKKLQKHRKPFLNVPREHLTKAEPIQNVPDVDKYGNPYGKAESIVALTDDAG